MSVEIAEGKILEKILVVVQRDLQEEFGDGFRAQFSHFVDFLSDILSPQLTNYDQLSSNSPFLTILHETQDRKAIPDSQPIQLMKPRIIYQQIMYLVHFMTARARPGLAWAASMSYCTYVLHRPPSLTRKWRILRWGFHSIKFGTNCNLAVLTYRVSDSPGIVLHREPEANGFIRGTWRWWHFVRRHSLSENLHLLSSTWSPEICLELIKTNSFRKINSIWHDVFPVFPSCSVYI